MADNNELARFLERVAQGDHDAFRDLYKAAAPQLFAVSLRLMGRRDQAEDVLQDAFVKVWRHAASFDRQRGSAMAWLVTTTRRCALDQLAKRQAHAHEEICEDRFDADDEIDLDSSPSEQSTAIRRCLSHLNARSRSLLLRAFFYGMTHDQLSKSYNMPLGTVKSTVRRSLLALRKCLST